MCAEMCSDYTYFGVQYAKTCGCGDEYGKYGKYEDDTRCSMKCSGWGGAG